MDWDRGLPNVCGVSPAGLCRSPERSYGVPVLLLLALFSSPDWSLVVPALAHSVPRLELRDGEGRKGTCSGAVFLIEDGWAYALTAAHCVAKDPTESFDITANGRNAVALSFNRILDLAIVKFRAKHEVAILLAATAPKAGADIAVAGYGFGVEQFVVQFGHVAQTFNQETKAIWLDAVTLFGDSGGVVVDEAGHLVALSSRFLNGGLFGQSAHISAAVPLEAVTDYLDEFRAKLHKK